MSVPATTWQLLHPRAIDGDTIRGYLTRETWLAAGFAATIYGAEQHDDGTLTAATTLLRLVIVDTPEHRPDAAEHRRATADVRAWLAAHPGVLMVDTYESGGWDRLLADVYPAGRRGETLTQHLLQLGWPIYRPPGSRDVPRD